MKCTSCEIEFEQTKSSRLFCSDRCRTREARRRHLKRHRKPSKVKEKSLALQNTTIQEYVDQRSHKAAYLVRRDGIRYYTASWNRDLKGQPCRNCGYNRHTELAHIIPVRDFPNSALLKEVHAKGNILPLCPNCHWEFDNGVLLLSNEGILYYPDVHE